MWKTVLLFMSQRAFSWVFVQRRRVLCLVKECAVSSRPSPSPGAAPPPAPASRRASNGDYAEAVGCARSAHANSAPADSAAATNNPSDAKSQTPGRAAPAVPCRSPRASQTPSVAPDIHLVPRHRLQPPRPETLSRTVKHVLAHAAKHVMAPYTLDLHGTWAGGFIDLGKGPI